MTKESMTVLAKFKCDTLLTDQYNKTVTLSAVTVGSEENKSFSKYTPNAGMNMTITKETEAYNFFEPGKEYYLEIKEAQND